jgi:capsular exopolysaccharide synthesis family protein
MKNDMSQLPDNDFRVYLGIIFRRKWTILASLLITVTIVSISQFKARHVYRATSQLLIEKEYTASPFQEGVAVDISGLDYYQTQYKIMKSRSLAKIVFDELDLKNSPEFSAGKGDNIDKFLQHILVDPIHGSRLVNLSAESFSPELAAKIANTLATAYVKQNQENRLFASREILKKLPQNVSLTELSTKDIEALPSVVSNSLIQGLKADLIKYESEYANLSGHYKSKHPSMVNLSAKIEQLRAQINQEMRNTVESLKTELSGEFKANNVRIVDPAEVPGSPVRPKRKRNIALAFVMGLAMGIGFAFFFEYMDNTIKTGSDIEHYLNLPFLGIVPKVKDAGDQHFIIESSNAPETEAIKTVRTNLVFSAPEDKLKTILITSCSPGEGKTFVSMNVAASFAQTGKKILLIDADLRRATLSKSLEFEKTDGLSNYLIGESTWEKIIQDTDIKNLSFISSGIHCPDPAELLGSDKMKELIEALKTRFDRIVIDSAPILPISDTLNISGLMDGIVQVVSCGKSNYHLVNIGKQKLQGVQAKIIGVILNHVNLKARGGYYGYSYYSYEYGKYT